MPWVSPQVIEFYSPLTIIVGANGCGKTTIIESLKYAVTGALPPGVKSGQSFVHDPKSCNQSSVKANIKLRFTNKAGRTMVVIRSMEVTQKKTNMTFKALDGVIRSTDKVSGEKVSLSHKCSELDKQVPDLIGVSTPILQHVVFCHQEDSSWPLQEGAVLKKRFDDIFDSTRYAKALEAIRKSKLEYSSAAKDVKAELAGLQAHLQAAEGLEADLTEATEKLDHIKSKHDRYTTTIDSLKEEADALTTKLAEMEDLRMQLDAKNQDLEQKRQVAESQLAMLEDPMDHVDDNALQDMLLVFDEVNSGADNRYREALEASEKLKATLETLQNARIEKCSLRGSLNAAKETHQVVIMQRNSLIDAMAKQFSLPLPAAHTTSSDMTPSQFSSYMMTLESHKSALQTELAKLKKSNQNEDDKIQSKLGELHGKQRSIEEQRSSNAASRASFESQLTQLSSDLSSKGRNTPDVSIRSLSPSPTAFMPAVGTGIEVDDAVRNAKRLSAERDAHSTNSRLQDIPKEIKSHESEIHKMQVKIENSNEALEQLRVCSDEENAVAMLAKQVDQDTHRLEESCKDLKERFPQFADELNAISAYDLPSLEACAVEVHGRLQTLKQAVATSTAEHADQQRSATENSALLKHSRHQLASATSRIEALNGADTGVSKMKAVALEIQTYDAEIGATIPGDLNNLDAATLFKACQETILDINVSLNTPRLLASNLKKLKKMAKIKNDDGTVKDLSCPCCLRGMNTHEHGVYAEQMDLLCNVDESPLIKVDSDQANSDKEKYQGWLDTINVSTKDWNEYRRLKKQVVDLKSEIEVAEEKFDSMETTAFSAKRKLETDCEAVTRVEELHAQVTKLRDSSASISEKKSEIESKKVSLATYAPSSDGKTLREVEREVQKFMSEKERFMKEIQDMNKEMAAINRNLQLASTRASVAEKAAREKQTQYDQYGSLDIKRSKMRDDISKCNALEQELGAQEAPLRQEVKALEAEKARVRDASSKAEEETSKKKNEFLQMLGEISSLGDKISKFNSGVKDKELESLNGEIQSMEDDIASTKVELEEMGPELEGLKADANDQERKKKVLRDTLAYRKTLEAVTELEDQANSMDEEIAGKETEDKKTQEEFDNTRMEIAENERKANKCEGQLQAMEDQVSRLEAKLNSKEYRNVNEQHRKALIKHELTQIAVADLEKYYVAVDKALLRYHGLKIDDINKIIRELWSLTYKGQDITNIRIVSGTEGASKSARSYNYRVVMTKGSTEMDMRGRCSAGQRVLASIVIRLALAETFCINCGVMTLDEPTTNLDYENKRGLAIALAQIIAQRSNQHNFQLIAITHDEDFVSMMKSELSILPGNFSMPDKYFYVSRKEGGDGKLCSQIDRVDWDEL